MIVYVHYDEIENMYEEKQEKKTVMAKFGSAICEVVTNKTSFWTLCAGSLRFFGGYCIAFYKPTYFQAVYPTMDT